MHAVQRQQNVFRKDMVHDTLEGPVHDQKNRQGLPNAWTSKAFGDNLPHFEHA